MRPLTPLVSLLLAFAAPAQISVPTARLEGHVVDPLHEPVGNAEIIVEYDGVVAARTRSDGNGTFVLPRVPARYVLVTAKADGPQIGAQVIDLWGQSRTYAELRTMPARRITGVVRDDAGAPVANAWVGASPMVAHDLSVAHCTTRSDDQGRFDLSHVGVGFTQVRAWTTQHECAPFLTEIDSNDDVELECVVERGKAIHRTVVLEGATPEQLKITELRVAAFFTDELRPLPPELARPEPVGPGHWELVGWNDIDHMHLWLEGDAVQTWPNAYVVENGRRSVRLRFHVREADAAIQGSVFDAEGNPVVGLGLMTQSLRAPKVNHARRTATTDANGQFVVQSPVDPGETFAMRSITEDLVLAGNDRNAAWFVQQHQANKHWRLDALPAVRLRLQLEDADGYPAVGTLTHVSHQPERGQPNGRLHIGSGVARLNGHVDIASLALDLPTVLVFDAAGPGGHAQMRLFAQGEGLVDLGKRRLAPAGEISGQVLGKGGEPVTGLYVYVSQFGRESLALVPNRNGRFRARGLQPGNYVVTALHSRTTRTTNHRVSVESGLTTEVELDVAPR